MTRPREIQIPRPRSIRHDGNHLRHRRTRDERDFFETNGYLIVEDALDEATTARLIAAAHKIDARERTEATRTKLLLITNVVHEDPALVDLIDCPADGVSNPPGAEPLCVKAGSAVIIDRRIWHSRSPNLWNETRKVVWYGYSYRWLRPKDAMTVSHLFPQLDPIRRQILGDGLSANGTYDPVDGDVPLRTWLREHCPEDVERTPAGRSQSRPPSMVRGKNLGRQ